MLNSGDRSKIEGGDLIGLYSYLSNEAAVIHYDAVSCDVVVVLGRTAQEVTSPLTFNVHQGYCRHYGFNAIYAGNTHTLNIYYIYIYIYCSVTNFNEGLS